MSNKNNQIAIVTGASSGIGRAIAVMLASEGMTVGLLGRSKTRLQQVAEEIINHGGKAYVYTVDLADEDEISDFRRQIEETYDGVQVLVHSAGAITLKSTEASSIDEFDMQYQVNLRAPYQLTQVLLPLIISCQGQIVFINSSAGLMTAKANVGQYAATKYGLRAFADSLRDELNNEGVRVLSVYPGRTASAMQAEIHKEEGRDYQPEDLMQPEDIAIVVKTALYLPRTAEMTDVSVRPMNKIKGK
jgi:short-subunit dehydrogenase